MYESITKLYVLYMHVAEFRGRVDRYILRVILPQSRVEQSCSTLNSYIICKITTKPHHHVITFWSTLLVMNNLLLLYREEWRVKYLIDCIDCGHLVIPLYLSAVCLIQLCVYWLSKEYLPFSKFFFWHIDFWMQE